MSSNMTIVVKSPMSSVVASHMAAALMKVWVLMVRNVKTLLLGRRATIAIMVT